jgi:hypothetical protein
MAEQNQGMRQQPGREDSVGLAQSRGQVRPYTRPAFTRRPPPAPPSAARRVRRSMGGFVAYLASWWRY